MKEVYERIAELSASVVKWQNEIKNQKLRISQAEANIATARKSLSAYTAQLEEAISKLSK